MFALTFSIEEKSEEDLDQEIDTDEVMEEVLDLELQTLHPILIDGVEFLFLDDISHALGRHQDKTLSIIAMYLEPKCYRKYLHRFQF